ncbi:hypothetical protein BGZ63DRAFT_46610 [Mariannaea sp. PMI_226]|nr:hypothetical protein BGZ63DRAFT_46610 [Mariannaea sp. PMI_226]
MRTVRFLCLLYLMCAPLSAFHPYTNVGLQHLAQRLEADGEALLLPHGGLHLPVHTLSWAHFLSPYAFPVILPQLQNIGERRKAPLG